MIGVRRSNWKVDRGGGGREGKEISDGRKRKEKKKV